AEVVIAEFVFLQVGGVEEEVGGVKLVVASELEGGAVKSLGAGTSDDIDDPAGGKAVFCAVVVAQDGEFADGVDGGKDQERPVGTDIGVGDSVDKPEVGVTGVAVHGEVRRAQQTDVKSIKALGPRRGARDQGDEGDEVAPVERKIANL